MDIACFSCGEIGHMARNCPAIDQAMDSEPHIPGARCPLCEDRCPRCNVPRYRHIHGQCGAYVWSHSNLQMAGLPEPDDPRHVHEIHWPGNGHEIPLTREPGELAGMNVRQIADELRELRDMDLADSPLPSPERDAAMRDLARRQAAESRRARHVM